MTSTGFPVISPTTGFPCHCFTCGESLHLLIRCRRPEVSLLQSVHPVLSRTCSPHHAFDGPLLRATFRISWAAAPIPRVSGSRPPSSRTAHPEFESRFDPTQVPGPTRLYCSACGRHVWRRKFVRPTASLEQQLGVHRQIALHPRPSGRASLNPHSAVFRFQVLQLDFSACSFQPQHRFRRRSALQQLLAVRFDWRRPRDLQRQRRIGLNAGALRRALQLLQYLPPDFGGKKNDDGPLRRKIKLRSPRFRPHRQRSRHEVQHWLQCPTASGFYPTP